MSLQEGLPSQQAHQDGIQRTREGDGQAELVEAEMKSRRISLANDAENAAGHRYLHRESRWYRISQPYMTE
jgi:hypothetical protein